MFLFGKRKKVPNVTCEVDSLEVPAGGIISGSVTINLAKPLESSGITLMLRVSHSLLSLANKNNGY